jgi:Cu+-exporting ATPase
MTGTDIAVLGAAALLTGFLAWYFFGPRKAGQAEITAGVQVVRVKVRGGYSPNLIQVVRGVPVRMEFDRQEAGDCSSRVVMPEFKINQALPAFQTRAVELMPQTVGDFGFACGMNMIHGRLQVVDRTAKATVPPTEANPALSAASSSPADRRQLSGAGLEGSADDEERDRRAEIADLTRRLIVGAVLTVPVLIAVLAAEVFMAGWVSSILLNPWLQLGLIAPVMLYSGWPIHRTGWLALAHRSAEMNSLITLGTIAAFGYSLVVTAAPQLLPVEVRAVYYEAVGVILTLILIGRLLEAKAKAGTGEAIKTLIGLQPRTARVIRGGTEVDVAVDEVVVGDAVVVRPGEKLAVDGQVVAGGSAVDESMVAGEPSPTTKTLGDTVIGATITRRAPSATPPPSLAPAPCSPRSSEWSARPRAPRPPSNAWWTRSPATSSRRSSRSRSGPSWCGRWWPAARVHLRPGRRRRRPDHRLPVRPQAGHTAVHHRGHRQSGHRRHPDPLSGGARNCAPPQHGGPRQDRHHHQRRPGPHRRPPRRRVHRR